MAINLLCSLLAISGEQIFVPDALLEELGDLRIGYAMLLYNYEKQLHNRPEAQEEFVKFLPRLFRRAVEDHSFQSHFNTSSSVPNVTKPYLQALINACSNC